MAPPRRWLVDGSNLVGSRPDGWWRDRPGAFTRLTVELEAYAARSGDDVTVVFDGAPTTPSGAEVAVLHAPSADDRMVEVVDADNGPATLVAVTSDRALADRLRRAGAGEVMGSGSFRRLLDQSGSA